jgi:hypothetical protein
MIVHVRNGSPVRSVSSGGRQISQRPANAMGSPSARWMKYGCFAF